MALRSLALAFALVLSGCGAKKGSPEAVADAFAQAYFQQADQQKAKEFTALGATEMLDRELHDTEQVRRDGYGANEASAEVTLQRGPSEPREQRVRVPFQVHIRVDQSHEIVRDADVELSKIDGEWKVVRLGIQDRAR